MAKQNLNPFSLFLVNWQQEGAEKALNNKNDFSLCFSMVSFFVLL